MLSCGRCLHQTLLVWGFAAKEEARITFVCAMNISVCPDSPKCWQGEDGDLRASLRVLGQCKRWFGGAGHGFCSESLELLFLIRMLFHGVVGSPSRTV